MRSEGVVESSVSVIESMVCLIDIVFQSHLHRHDLHLPSIWPLAHYASEVGPGLGQNSENASIFEATSNTPLPGCKTSILEVGQNRSDDEARKNAPLSVQLHKVFALAPVMAQDLHASKWIKFN